MRTLIRFLGKLAVVALVVFGALWWWAGRADGPAVDLKQPGKFIGRATSLELSVQAPGGQFSRVDVALEQNGQTHQVFTLEQQGQSQVKQEAADRLYVMRPVGKLAIPELKSGTARITVRAARPGALRPAAGGDGGHARRAGAARAAAGVAVSRRSTTSITAAASSWSTA